MIPLSSFSDNQGSDVVGFEYEITPQLREALQKAAVKQVLVNLPMLARSGAYAAALTAWLDSAHDTTLKAQAGHEELSLEREHATDEPGEETAKANIGERGRAPRAQPFNRLADLIPKTIADEQIGDAIEVINDLRAEGKKLQATIYAFRACAWALVHSVLDFFLSALPRRRSE